MLAPKFLSRKFFKKLKLNKKFFLSIAHLQSFHIDHLIECPHLHGSVIATREHLVGFFSKGDASNRRTMTLKCVNFLERFWIVDEDFVAFVAHCEIFAVGCYGDAQGVRFECNAADLPFTLDVPLKDISGFASAEEKFVVGQEADASDWLTLQLVFERYDTVGIVSNDIFGQELFELSYALEIVEFELFADFFLLIVRLANFVEVLLG